MEAEKIVFICSPYGGLEANILLARRFMRMAAGLGFTPFAPHVMLHGVLDDNRPNQRIAGMEMGLLMLQSCRHLWICGDTVSPGMALEIQQAEDCGTIITRYNLADLEAWEKCCLHSRSRFMLWHDWNAGHSFERLCRVYGYKDNQELLAAMKAMVDSGSVVSFADRSV